LLSLGLSSVLSLLAQHSLIHFVNKVSIYQMLVCSSSVPEVKCIVFQILVNILNEHQAYNVVLEALDLFSYKLQENQKYLHLTTILRHESPQVQTLLLELINLIISSPEDVSERTFNRSCFSAVAIETVLTQIKSTPDIPPPLLEEILEFETEAKEDKIEIAEKLKQISSTFDSINIESSHDLCNYLAVALQDLPTFQQLFQSILQNLCLLPTDRVNGLKQWLIVQSVICQMTAKKESISFFTKGEVSKVDMNGLYDMIKDRSKVEEEKEQCLAEVTRLKQELEETHTKYQARLKTSERELKQLYGQLNPTELKPIPGDVERINNKNSWIEPKFDLHLKDSQIEELTKKLSEAEKILGLKVGKHKREQQELALQIESLTKENLAKEAELANLQKMGATQSSIKIEAIRSDLEAKHKVALQELEKEWREKQAAQNKRHQEEIKTKIANIRQQKDSEIQSLTNHFKETQISIASQSGQVDARLNEQLSENRRLEEKYSTQEASLSLVHQELKLVKKQYAELQTITQAEKLHLQESVAAVKQERDTLLQSLTSNKELFSTQFEEQDREIKKYKTKKDQMKQAHAEKLSRLLQEQESQSFDFKQEKERLVALIDQKEKNFESQKLELLEVTQISQTASAILEREYRQRILELEAELATKNQNLSLRLHNSGDSQGPLAHNESRNEIALLRNQLEKEVEERRQLENEVAQLSFGISQAQQHADAKTTELTSLQNHFLLLRTDLTETVRATERTSESISELKMLMAENVADQEGRKTKETLHDLETRIADLQASLTNILRLDEKKRQTSFPDPEFSNTPQIHVPMSRGGGAPPPPHSTQQNSARLTIRNRGGPAPPVKLVWNGPKPTVPMKNLNWGKMPPNKFSQTVFRDMKADRVPIPTTELESLFALQVKKSRIEKMKTQVEEKKSLVGPKIYQNTSIFLRTNKIPISELPEIILTTCGVNDSYLDEDYTRKLLDNLGNPEVVDKIQLWLSETKSPLEKLDDVDRFLVTVHSIPQVKFRLETWYFSLTFRERFDKAKQELLRIKAAVNVMRENDSQFLTLSRNSFWRLATSLILQTEMEVLLDSSCLGH